MRLLQYIFIITLCGICVSCQKELDNTETPPINIDSIISVLPKQVIQFVGPQNVQSGVYSIKYDTANLRIEVYIDDTLTTTPYDELSLTYQFNNSGYLINSKFEYAGTVVQSATISRQSDNKINRIVEIYYDGTYGNYYDSIFFKYEPTASGTIITNYHHRDYPDGYNWKDTVVYIYDHDFKLQQAVMGYDGILNVKLEYNNHKNISKTELRSIEFLMTSEFAYQSGLPEASDDLLMKAFLGKDHYLYWIQRNYLFKIVEETPFYTFSLTNPQHLTKLTVTEQIPGQVKTYTKNWSYQLDSEKRLSQVRGPVFEEEDITYIFKY